MNFELYADQELIGIYSSRHSASIAAFELMIDGLFQSFKIIEAPPTIENLIQN